MKTIVIRDDITLDDTLKVIRFLRANAGENVLVNFDSDGGTMRAGWILSNAFEAHGRVTAIVSRAYSAAAIALSGCAYRVGQPECKVGLHGCHYTDGRPPDRDLRINDWVQAFVMARHLNQPPKRIHGWIQEDKTFRDFVGVSAGFLHVMDRSNGTATPALMSAFAMRRVHPYPKVPANLRTPAMAVAMRAYLDEKVARGSRVGVSGQTRKE